MEEIAFASMLFGVVLPLLALVAFFFFIMLVVYSGRIAYELRESRREGGEQMEALLAAIRDLNYSLRLIERDQEATAFIVKQQTEKPPRKLPGT